MKSAVSFILIKLVSLRN